MSAAVELAVVFGGPTDYERSCASAAAVAGHLDRHRFVVRPIRVTSAGTWVIGREMHGTDATDVDGLLHATRDELSWSGFSPADSLTAFITAVSTCHLVFPLLHGPHGEGGTLPALLELVQVPYVGNGVLAGVAGTHRGHAGKLLTAAGLAVADDEVADGAVADGAVAADRTVVTAVLQYPDGRVVAGPPLTLGGDGAVQGEPDPAVVAVVQRQAVQAFHALGCSGLLQVDFVLPTRGPVARPVVGAVDVLPELTASSRFASAWRAAGVGFDELVTTLVETGLATVRSRHTGRVGLSG